MYLKILEKRANRITVEEDKYARFLLPYRVQVYGKKNRSFMSIIVAGGSVKELWLSNELGKPYARHESAYFEKIIQR